MTTLRYVKTLEQVKKARDANPEFLDSSVRSIRCEYETHPAIAASLVPKPLVANTTGEMCVTFSQVAIHITPEFTMEIGSTIFGVKVSYDGQNGIYLVTMPMTTEQAVIGGRETYGEPKKIADIVFQKDGNAVSASVTRMGMTYLSVSGSVGQELGAREMLEHGFCYKAMPSCDGARALDADPLLVRLDWRHKHENAWKVDDAALTLGASPLDPVADVPVLRLTRCEYEEGSSQSDGTVLRSVPEEWLLPFLHQRYDDTSGDGIEVEV